MKVISVNTEGEAFLRNGFSRVKALRVELRRPDEGDGTSAVYVVNTRGTITNGGIWVPKPALMELARQLLMTEPPYVLVEVDKGVASVTECPDWISVEIRDHDVAWQAGM